MVALLVGCGTTPPGGSVVEELARDQLGVSILSINLLDVVNYPHGPTGVNWRTRHTRIIDWIATTRNFPDIIALQEASGYWSCPTDDRRMPDYASLDFLVDGVRNATGEQYRVAYMVAHKEGQSSGEYWIDNEPGQFCRNFSGRALLYRPSKVRNVIVNAPAGETVYSYNDASALSTHLTASLPCCSPAGGREDICNFIDGLKQSSNRCQQPTALGLAWTRRQPANGNIERPMDVVFSRFELVGQPGNFFHLYNVHRRWPPRGITWKPDIANINQLITDMEVFQYGSSGTNLYPPIIVGDFNLSAADSEAELPRFVSAAWTPEVIGAMFGRPDVFAAKQRAYANGVTNLPNDRCEVDEDPATLWSDHCALYFRVEPSLRRAPASVRGETTTNPPNPPHSPASQVCRSRPWLPGCEP